MKNYATSAGFVGDYLLWINDVYYTIKNKYDKRPESKFDMETYLLSKRALEEGIPTKRIVITS